MATRATFHFSMDAVNTKTNAIRVHTIQLEGSKETFQFPSDMQAREQHPELFATEIVKNVTKSMKTRGQYRNIKISLVKELKDIYLDEEENVCFKDQYLDEVRGNILTETTSHQAPSSEKSLRTIVKDMVMEKFLGKNQDAKSFLVLFERECKRFKIEEPRFAEILKLFLEGPAMDWFLAGLKSHGLDLPWELWKESFLETFSERGWAEISYAYNFRYINGPLLDYALRKRNLLLDTDLDLSEKSQTNFIVLGLPLHVRSRINKKDINSMNGLMSTIRQLEHLVINKERTQISLKTSSKSQEKKTLSTL